MVIVATEGDVHKVQPGDTSVIFAKDGTWQVWRSKNPKRRWAWLRKLLSHRPKEQAPHRLDGRV